MTAKTEDYTRVYFLAYANNTLSHAEAVIDEAKKSVSAKDKKVESALGEIRKQNRGFARLVAETFVECGEDAMEALEGIQIEINNIEAGLLKGKTKNAMKRILTEKRVLINFRRKMHHNTRAVNYWSRRLKEERFRDAHDFLLHLDETTATYQDLLSNIMDAYLAIVSNNLNEVMKVLTIIATIALPLTVISSIYGMNIALPAQHDPLAVAYVFALMALVTVVLLLFFLRKGWLKSVTA